ncbi:MAG: hypothetical protein JKY26_01250 [Pseudomonas sp.]|nr:hypothetical protein [Pseudomonas sp.]
MDLQDFDGQLMYFDEPMSDDVRDLIALASELYGQADEEGAAEAALKKALTLAPDNLAVLVALYRFYYYQHRLRDALAIAHDVLLRVAPDIGFPADWERLTARHLANAVQSSFTLVRFYLMTLKGAAYLNLRLDQREIAVRMLSRIVEFDSHDRLGAKALLMVVGPTELTLHRSTSDGRSDIG